CWSRPRCSCCSISPPTCCTSSPIRGCGADVADPPIARRSHVLRRLLTRPPAAIAGGVVLLFVGLALAAPHVAPFDPVATNFLAVRKPPSAIYRLGTDQVGRDVLSRLLWGG